MTQTQQQRPKNKQMGPQGKRKQATKPPRSFGSQLLSVLFIFMVLMLAYSLLSDLIKGSKEPFTVSELAEAVKRGEVTSLVVKGDEVTATFAVPEGSTSNAEPIERVTTKEPNVSITETLSAYGVTSEMLSKPTLEVRQPSNFQLILLSLLPYVLMLIILVVVSLYFMRQFRGAGMQALSFGQSRARITDPRDANQKVTFADVAGAKEAKEELVEIVDFLKNPKKFLQIGARIPKGVLMMGAPGTGKTLLARAVAGEANVPFFSISGSEFVEMFVGVGASRVRDLFRTAKLAAPAIIFIDEIDAVGRARGVGIGGGNDEREQTLNQILVEMDGFEPNEKVIVMAATNRPDVLDAAILRPGRFDRRVTIDLPDRADREAILKVQSKGKPLAEDVDLRVIAERTPGFSGADLYSLMNEGAILAARENRTLVSQFDLIRSIEKVLLGPERRSHLLSTKEKELTAYHEAGHALVASVLPNADPVHKISVISRGRAAGYTLKLPIQDRRLQNRSEFLDDIAMSLGGYVTEKILYGDVTTGPQNDLQVSTALARDMVTKFGMSDKLGAMAFETNGSTIAGSGSGLDGKEYSESVGAEIDAEVSRIMREAYQTAEKIITEHRPLLDAIAKRLIEKETIERDEFESILVAHGITPKKGGEGIVVAGQVNE